MLFSLFTTPFPQIILSILILLGIFFLFHHQYKKFFTTDPAPDIINLNTLREIHLTSGVIEVKTGLFIKSFSEFELEKNNFVMDAIVWFKFNPILIPLSTVEKFSFDRGKIINKSEAEITIEEDYLLVKYNIRLQFSNNLDFRFFPFDNHRLHIVLSNENVTPLESVFEIDQSAFSLSADLDTNDWKIKNKAANSGYAEALIDPADPNKIISHPKVIYNLDLVQKGLRKATLIFLPVFFILFLSSFALALDPGLLAAEMLELGAISLSALLFYRFVIENITPKVGYSTLTDYFFNAALICDGFTFVLILLRVILPQQSVIAFIASWWLFLISLFMLIYIYYLFKQRPDLPAKKLSLHQMPYNFCKKSRFHPILMNSLNLSTLTKYCLQQDEFPSPDNQNWLNPDYSSANKNSVATGVERFLWKLTCKFQTKPLFSLMFEELLLELVIKRKELMAGDFVIKLNPGPKAKFIIWGDLHGAFHSLIRDLKFLKEQKILEEDLKILDPNIYFIFNGNVVDLSPYSLETLTVVLRLMKLNPNNVFYIKGDHESNEQWRDNQTENELKIKTNYFYKKYKLDYHLSHFFDTLPLAIYIKSANTQTHELMRISHFGFNKSTLDELSLENFLSSDTETKIDYSPINKYFGQRDFIKMDVIIYGRTTEMHNRTTEGLAIIEPEQGATTWSILSSPTSTFKTIYNFHYDAFLQLDLNDTLLDSTLTLYRQDVLQLTPENHFDSDIFHLVYGLRLNDKGFPSVKSKNPIVFGSSIDFSKAVAMTGKRLYEGLKLGILRQNMQGGIQSAPIRLIVLNDKYTPYNTLKNASLLLNTCHTDILLSPLGSSTTEALLPLMHDKKILVLFPFSGSDKLRKPDLNYIIHARSSYSKEADALMTYAVEILGLERLAIFYQNDSLGLGPLDSVRKKLKQYSISDWLEIPYQRNDPNAHVAAQKIREFNPAVILFFSSQAPSIALMHTLGFDQASGKVLMGLSFMTDIFRDFLHTAGLELIISRVIPNVNSKNIPIVQEFKKMISIQNQGSICTQESLEGYINSRILMSVLELLDPPYTKEKIIKQLESFKAFNLDGLILNFDPMTRELSNDVWIDVGSDEWISF